MDNWDEWGDQDPIKQREEWDKRVGAKSFEVKVTFKQIKNFFKKLFGGK